MKNNNPYGYAHTRQKPVTLLSRCGESNCVLCYYNSDITAKTNLNGLETMSSFILKLSRLNIIHQVFLVLIAVPQNRGNCFFCPMCGDTATIFIVIET